MNNEYITIRELWSSDRHDDWKTAVAEYDLRVKRLGAKSIETERIIAGINAEYVKGLSKYDFYLFLSEKYFPWKYSAQNRLKTSLRHFIFYKENLDELDLIRKALFSFNVENIELGLKIAKLIKGLGTAGASGLLAILFPEYFGTVDQFVVLSLKETGEQGVYNIKEEDITIKDAVVLEKLMKEKADRLNKINGINYWTPRKIDKVLWAKGHSIKH